jgi:L-glutamine-phosphate cytidylyltransferase
MTKAASKPTTAIILAAGMGTRLQGVDAARGLPKGLLALDGEPLMARALRLLGEQGIERTVMVVGHLKEAYQSFLEGRTDVELVENPAYASTGTMASLACGLERVDEDFLLLESDLVYEARALELLMAHANADVILGSGPTRAGDEVWIEAPEGLLINMSKEKSALGSVCGELVGLCRISAALGAALRGAYAEFVQRHRHGRMSYETDALVQVARERAIPVQVVPDLLWGEIDDDSHFQRVRDQVLPAIRGRR